MTYRDRMKAVTTHLRQVVECVDCGDGWQRPAGSAGLVCPPCERKQNNGGRPLPGEQLAHAVAVYRLAIEEATNLLRHDRVVDALTVLLKVEAPGRARVARPGRPPKVEPPVRPIPSLVSRVQPEEPSPLDLVKSLASGAYRVPVKEPRGRRRRP